MEFQFSSIKNSISTKLFRLVFFLYFLITVILTAIQMMAEYNHVKDEILQEIHLVKNAVAADFAASLWNYEQQKLEDALRGLADLPMVLGVRVMDDDGMLFGARGTVRMPDNDVVMAESYKQWTVLDEENFPDLIEYEFELTYKIYAKEDTGNLPANKYPETMGTLIFYSSHGIVFDRVKYGFQLILINSLIKTLALWAIFLWLARIVLGHPLEQFIAAIREIDLGNLQLMKVHRITKGTDELTIFEDTFNLMISKLIDAREDLKDSAKKLEEQNQKLHQMDQLKDDFLARTSHELRTPLHGMVGIAQSVLEDPQHSLTNTIMRDLDLIVAGGKRLEHLVTNILDFAKLRHESVRLNRKAVDVRQIVAVVLHLSQTFLGGRNIKLKNEIPIGFPRADADEDRLLQIFHNLIGNAIKFTNTGEVKVYGAVKAGHLEIEVSDTGIGIPEEQLETIFSSFEQVKHSTLRHFEGVGLGLTITRRLIEEHGGKVHVRSLLGVGSIFTITLPMAPKTVAVREQKSALNERLRPLTNSLQETDSKQDTKPETLGSQSEIGRLRILAVDDDPTNLRVIANFLRIQHYQATCVLSGPEAMDWVATHGQPDLVLLDVMMPHMNGFDVCRKLREACPISDLPIIFLTASHRRSDLETGFATGANDFLTKPFDKQELLARIHAHLKVLVARYQLISLRDYANQIASFRDHGQMFQLALEKMKQIRTASEIVLFRENTLYQPVSPPYQFLEQRPNMLFIDELDLPLGEVHIMNFLKPDSSLLQFYQKYTTSSELDGGHMAFLQPSASHEYLICLFREKHWEPFTELERQYLLSMLNQVRHVEKNIQTMLSDQLVRVLPEVQPHLSRITHISSENPYCFVYFENEEEPKLVRISLSNLNLYFDDEQLLKVHKSHLINPKKVLRIEKSITEYRNYHYQVVVGTLRKNFSLRVGPSFLPRLIEQYPHFFKDPLE